ncbi:acyl--CoA ligase [Phragmitibacter flavus]|uniref:Acyl--CoA ligase n=1 Tax=Phragmitibacter flavus TaxID=2576071 RepID=A0A5R8K940_9BACT|nr:class I adenylate-forming enzyme family protein [Phragmitibacter flavus]TLD68837.1 acyl--CoA ligase [Phragmitibacter flavus]
MINIVDEIFAGCDRSATALVAGGVGVSFGELEAKVSEAAGLLGKDGAQRVGLFCPNGVHHVVWSLAVLRAGGVLVPVAGELSGPERESLVRTTGLDVVLCAGGKDWAGEGGVKRELLLDGMPGLLVSGLRGEGRLDFDEGELAKLNPALIRFSSGTTGNRKGVVLSHETLLARVRACNQKLGIGPGDRVIWTLPMAHHFAVSIVLYLLHGATTVLEDSHLGADVYRTLKAERGTVLYGSPFHFALLAGLAEGERVESLRLAVATAAALSEQVAKDFYGRYGVPLCQGMGIIEVGLPLLNGEEPLEKPESVGRPQAGFEVMIANAGIEGVGELGLRGPGMFDAYLSPWMLREEVLKDGWFATGDLAKRDADGAIYLVGRTKSVINVGGMKCFPEEVEAVLCGHPAVKEARVSAMAHATFGAVPAAEVVPEEGASPPRSAELMGWCRKELSGYKVPMRYTMVAELPKTASGKLQR